MYRRRTRFSAVVLANTAGEMFGAPCVGSVDYLLQALDNQTGVELVFQQYYLGQ